MRQALCALFKIQKQWNHRCTLLYAASHESPAILLLPSPTPFSQARIHVKVFEEHRKSACAAHIASERETTRGVRRVLEMAARAIAPLPETFDNMPCDCPKRTLVVLTRSTERCVTPRECCRRLTIVRLLIDAIQRRKLRFGRALLSLSQDISLMEFEFSAIYFALIAVVSAGYTVADTLRAFMTDFLLLARKQNVAMHHIVQEIIVNKSPVINVILQDPSFKPLFDPAAATEDNANANAWKEAWLRPCTNFMYAYNFNW